MSNNKDLVSIVLPVYNGEKYLALSIESIIAQTYDNWELIIIDDCSTDDSASIAKEYSKKDNRIHYYMNDINFKLPRSLNKGFSIAKGYYLTWTSDDNLYKPQAIEKMVNALENDEDSDFVFASCRIINEVNNEIEYIMVDEFSKKRIVGLDSVGACFMYTRKVYETVGDYDPNYTLVEDFDYWQRIFMKFNVVTISEILYLYRWHDGALTSTMKQEQFNSTLEKMLLKNRRGFGRISLLEEYYYYYGLNRCRVNLKSSQNPYRIKYKLLSIYYFLFVRVPNKLKRMF